ncbi:type II toxin-antitoxin system RelE/ParE family toxin [Tritonibacter scottomollicae]|uniref:Type II toxin-antitoxin system RelE/ParE family toxin n=1 Tax=Tritonibacter scottomollicae TaxID=483013 RepID=A0ABZ0HBA8_TRISK|nr:type II toxin-antitoxin system RelE/ParE family toxin [Tritonibacter scottomollicae]WOI31351.1 type II toxin-antitoxin system RelE/ParE family toxin [Tritonibacter scottomollicae]
MTSKPWVLTRQAEDSLQDIADWTFATFGPRQAQVYGEELIDRCTGLAQGHVPSRPCRALVAPDLPDDLRYVRAGQHYVVFIDGPDQLIVIDFLHVRCDLPRRLAALGEDTTG